jgi:D-alanine-D-alanine ligase
VQVADAVVFTAAQKPTAEEVIARLGESVVVKPNNEGSSVGLALTAGRAELAAKLADIKAGSWLIEPRLIGRELSIGVLHGKAMGVVEIRPKSGVYDYTSKYTKGLTEYFAPAPLDPATTAAAQRAAETAFAACGCRDYSRVDFILNEARGLFAGNQHFARHERNQLAADERSLRGTGFRGTGAGIGHACGAAFPRGAALKRP